MELLILSGLCALIGLGCLGGAVFSLLGGEDVGVERIFLVIVWGMFGMLFLGMAGWIARQGPLKKTAPKEARESAAPAGAGKTSS
jgi:hypothetical protein